MRSIVLISALIWLQAPAFAQPVVLNFDELSAMQYFPLTPVHENARLSDQYLKKHGVVFSSASPYVAVSALGPNHAVSGANAIAGADANGVLTYDHTHPIVARFFDPVNPTVPATTEWVSVRTDLWGEGSSVELKAFDVKGNLIDTCNVMERGGETLKVSGPGIHFVEFHGGRGVALDDFTFPPVTSPGGRGVIVKPKLIAENVPPPAAVQGRPQLDEEQSSVVWIALIAAGVCVAIGLFIACGAILLFAVLIRRNQRGRVSLTASQENLTRPAQ